MERCDLSALPLDVLAIVGSKLEGEDLARLQASCRTFATRIDAEERWKALFQKEYGGNDRRSPAGSWKTRFAMRRRADRNRVTMCFSVAKCAVELASDHDGIHAYKIIGNDLIAGIRPSRQQCASCFELQVWSLEEHCLVHRIATEWDGASYIQDIDTVGNFLAVVRESGQVGAWEVPNLGNSSANAQLSHSLLFFMDMTSYLAASAARYVSRMTWTSVAVINPLGSTAQDVSVLVSATLPHSHSILYLLSGDGELLSRFLLPTLETYLSHSRDLLMYRDHPSSHHTIVSVGSWEVIGEDLSDINFGERMRERVEREGERLLDFAIVGRYLCRDTLVRFGSYRSDIADGSSRRRDVVWGGKISCFARCQQENSSQSMDEGPTSGVWHFDVPANEGCEDVNVLGDGGALILTREEDSARSYPSRFKVWKARSNELIGALDLRERIEAPGGTSIDSYILGHLHLTKATMLRGTGNSVVVSIELHYHNISRNPCRAIAFWTVFSDELSILPLDRGRMPLGNWRWVVSLTRAPSKESPQIQIYDFGGVQ
ncbi:hypothetical protein BSKO_07639 [Bryopsis sp. KO-2023]|nr:hypothetical protein BSKO_07639 [Bryopsis sp. KO-2023]